jgi:hypothetical protein
MKVMVLGQVIVVDSLSSCFSSVVVLHLAKLEHTSLVYISAMHGKIYSWII